MQNENIYLEILDFISNKANLAYARPENTENHEERVELEGLRELGRIASENMKKLCKLFSNYFNLKHHTPIRWLKMDNRTIRDYLWGQLSSKDQDNNFPFSISIFAEHGQFRISLELNIKTATLSDYITYHSYLDLPIEQHLRIWGKINDEWGIINKTPDEVKIDVNNYVDSHRDDESYCDGDSHFQLCYIIPRKSPLNEDNTAEFFYNEFITGFTLLLPYYNHIITR